MASLLQGTVNTRAILPESLRCIRSDAPTRITDEDIAWLYDHGVRTVVDLRTDAERTEKPCPLASDVRFTCLSLPVTGGNALPSSPDGVAESYIRMVDGRMQEIIAAIRGADTGVLYFCSAGKDRTGVVSAILMKEYGIDDEAIIADYMESDKNLKNQLEAYAKATDTDINIIMPREETMVRFLRWYEECGKSIIKNTELI